MTIQTVAILGFQPDLSPDTPGVLTYTSGTLPTTRGIGQGIGVQPASNTFAGTSYGGAEIRRLYGTTRQFIGTSTKLYELVGGVATDRTNPGGGGVYHASSTDLWSFAQFGDTTLAANKGDRLQASDGAGFVDAHATAPKGRIVITPGMPNRTFVMLFDYNDGTDNVPDGIYWTPTPLDDWTPSIANQIGNVRITDVNGGWTAAIEFRDGVLAFKASSMYLGSYVGGSDQWAWTRVSNSIGCLGPNAVCHGDVDRVYFADQRGVWMFDGSYPRPLPGAIHDWWATQAAAAEARLTWDADYHQLWCRYDVASSAGLHVVYNSISNLWTNYGAITSTNHLITGSLAASGSTTSLFSVVNKNYAFAPASVFRLSPIGSDYQTTLVRSIQPLLLQGPSDTATGWLSGVFYHDRTLRNVLSQQLTPAIDPPGRLNCVVQDFWLQAEVQVAAGNTWECNRVVADMDAGGKA